MGHIHSFHETSISVVILCRRKICRRRLRRPCVKAYYSLAEVFMNGAMQVSEEIHNYHPTLFRWMLQSEVEWEKVIPVEFSLQTWFNGDIRKRDIPHGQVLLRHGHVRSDGRPVSRRRLQAHDELRTVLRRRRTNQVLVCRQFATSQEVRILHGLLSCCIIPVLMLWVNRL